MIIAVNTIFTEGNVINVTDNFVDEVFSRIIKSQLQHTFIIIFKEPYTPFIQADNVINIGIPPNTGFLIKWFTWHNNKLKEIIKKYKPDIFISYKTGLVKAHVPQCILIPDLNFMHHPEIFKKSELVFNKKHVVKSWENACLIITVSEFCKAEIIKYCTIEEDRIRVVYRGVDSTFDSEILNNKEEIKAQYADGNEYFLYTGEISVQKNLLNLLKAFSAFKKRQKSNMQLIIAGKPGFKFEKIMESLRLFKFKNEVKIVTDFTNNEIQNIIMPAYGFVYPSASEAFPTEVIQAMKSNVPVITSPVASMPETCMNTVLYAQPDNFKEIAVQMMQLYKNENLRDNIAEKGKEQAEKFSWKVTSDLVWENIQAHIVM